MAQDGELPKSVDKGKGKAIDGEASKAEEFKKDKDGKPLVVQDLLIMFLPGTLSFRVQTLSSQDREARY